VKAQYFGCYEPSRPNGLVTIHEAVTNLTSNRPADTPLAEISVTPQMIRINISSESEVNCPVKDLKFLAMAKDVKICAFIIQNGAKCSVHVFRCKRSSLTLCKNIEAVCKAMNN
jgi:hypothetical protein